MKKFFEPLEERRLLSTTYFVAASGSDGNSGTSASNAFASLQQAANSVRAGDTVDVESGSYAGFKMTGTSGSSGAPIVFDFLSGAKITSSNGSTGDGIDIENSNYVTVEGATITNNGGDIVRAGIRLAECDNFQLLNNNVNGMGAWGLYTSHSSDGLIEGNVCANSIGQHGIYVANSSSDDQIIGNIIYGNANCGIHINGDDSQGGSGIMTGFLVANNIIYDNGATGGSSINCDGVQDSVFENNLIYDNQNKGICLFQGDSSGASINDVVVNNTIIESANVPSLEIVDGSTGATVFNNILIGKQDIDSASESGLQSANNITSGDLGTLFVNADVGNYELVAASPALGAGVSSFAGVSAPTTDILGTAVTSPVGVGAFASGSSGLVFIVPSGSASSGTGSGSGSGSGSSGSGSSGSGSTGDGSGSGSSGSGSSGSGSSGSGTSGSGSGSGSSGSGSSGSGSSGTGSSGTGSSGSGSTGTGTSDSGSGSSSSGGSTDGSGSSGDGSSGSGTTTIPLPPPPPPPPLPAPAITLYQGATPVAVPGWPTLVAMSSWGVDSRGLPITYTWTASGPGGVTFSNNGNSTANSSMAVLSQAGTYTFTVVMTSADGATTASAGTIIVAQQVTGVYVQENTSTMSMGGTQKFSAIAVDQFGQIMNVPQDSFLWSTSGLGSIDAIGDYVAPWALPGGASSSSADVYATINGVVGAGQFAILAPAGFTGLGPPAQ